ncbi:MAG TPA: FAD-dependent oxidoreductase [Actinomycetota bacterium]|nr:FAD-dependent oxidoreductase [Actinomycetota bacterium]
MASGPIVIVGANLAGGRAAEELRKKGFDGPITMIGDEPDRPYERPPLSKEFLRGQQPLEKAFLRPEEWYAENDVTLMLGTRAERLDLDARAVDVGGGERVPFDKLLLVTGGRPRRLDAPGADLPGITTFRTYRDAAALAEVLRPGARVVVVGAGFIGSEIAASARTLGCEVTLFEAEAVPLVRALGEELGKIHGQIHRDNGVDLRTGIKVEGFEGDTRVHRVLTSEGAFDADVVIVGVGIQPNVELAKDAGISVSNGIDVDELCRTSAPGVSAAGDVAKHPNRYCGEPIRVEHWQNAQNQGAAAARAMLGGTEPFEEVPWFWSDQYDLNLQMSGHPLHWDQMVYRGDVERRSFSAFYLDKGRLVACTGFNRGKDVRGARALIEAGMSPAPAVLSDESTDLRALAKQAQK